VIQIHKLYSELEDKLGIGLGTVSKTDGTSNRMGIVISIFRKMFDTFLYIKIEINELFIFIYRIKKIMNKTLKTTKILKLAKKIKGIKLLGGKCKKCGDENIFHLSFHHPDDNKEFSIANKKNIRWSIIENEIKKCELLCENCHAEKHYVEDNKGDKSRRSEKLIYLEYKGNKCEICGYNKCEASLTFHHRNSNDKLFDIGSLSQRITNISELKNYIIDELDKCDILCRNCHREKHSDLDFFEKNKDQIYKKIENYNEVQNKLSREDVINMYNSGIKQIDIAKHYSASKGTISMIIKEWKEK